MKSHTDCPILSRISDEMAILAYSVMILAVLIVDFDSVAADSLREQIISEVKSHFDKEIMEIKRKHETEIAALDAKLTKNQAEISDLRLKNEILSNELRKVLFTLEHQCKTLCQSVGGQKEHTSSGNRKISETGTHQKGHTYIHVNESKYLLDRGGENIETRRKDNEGSSLTTGHVSTSGVKSRDRSTCKSSGKHVRKIYTPLTFHYICSRSRVYKGRSIHFS